MTTTADNLRDLHALHQRAKAIRDRLASGPKTVATRQAVLARRKGDLEAAHVLLKKTKADIKTKETQAQSIRGRVDELRGKLNVTKKQAEYDAIRNQIAADNLNASKVEEEALALMVQVEQREAELKTQEAEVAKLASEVEALAADVAGGQDRRRWRLVGVDLGDLEPALHLGGSVAVDDHHAGAADLDGQVHPDRLGHHDRAGVLGLLGPADLLAGLGVGPLGELLDVRLEIAVEHGLV